MNKHSFSLVMPIFGFIIYFLSLTYSSIVSDTLSYLIDIFSAAMHDSTGGPGRRWSAGASLPGPDAKVHSLPDSPSALDTPTEDTTMATTTR